MQILNFFHFVISLSNPHTALKMFLFILFGMHSFFPPSSMNN